MLTICNICLLSNRKLWSLNKELENFYDELSDYNAGSIPQKFCSECIFKLKKSYDFKKNCQFALVKLKTWSKQEIKKPIDLLYTEMPPSQLRLSSKQNFKIYFYQTADVTTTTSIQMPSSNHPNIVTVNIPRDEHFQLSSLNLVFGKAETFLINEQDIKKETIEGEEIENQTCIKSAEAQVKHTQVENAHDEELGSNDDISDIENEVFNKDTDSDSDGSMKELNNILKTLKKPTKTLLEITGITLDDDINNAETKKNCKRKSYSKMDSVLERRRKLDKYMTDEDKLKENLRKKFERYGPVKTLKGNVIDLDMVVNNIDKLNAKYTVGQKCSEPGPLSPYVIGKLSELDDCVKYGSVFDTLYLKDPKEIKAQFEKRRTSASYLSRAHRCEICITSYISNVALSYHKRQSHNPDAPFECSVCHVRRGTRKGLTYHCTTHKTLYNCKLCEYITGNRNTMRVHFYKHKGIALSCEYCDKTYTAMSSLFNHINKVHATPHICKLCAGAFNTMRGLIQHSALKHADEKFVESEHNTLCEECNITFVSDDIYRQHLRITHKERERQQIRVQRRRRTIGCRRRPKKIRSYSCHLCEWKGRYLSMKQDHYKTQHPNAEIGGGGNFLCQECGKQFKSFGMFAQHQSKHLGSEVVRKHACTKCPKSFFTELSLRQHTLRHFPPTYECQVCGKKFHTGAGLYIHNNIHINNRRFVCDICSKGFLDRAALKAHVAGVHHHIRRKRKPRQKNIDSE